MTRDQVIVAVAIGIIGNLVTLFAVLPMISWARPKVSTWLISRFAKLEHRIFWRVSRRETGVLYLIMDLVLLAMAIFMLCMAIALAVFPLPERSDGAIAFTALVSVLIFAFTLPMLLYEYWVLNTSARYLRQYDLAKSLTGPFLTPTEFVEADHFLARVENRQDFRKLLLGLYGKAKQAPHYDDFDKDRMDYFRRDAENSL